MNKDDHFLQPRFPLDPLKVWSVLKAKARLLFHLPKVPWLLLFFIALLLPSGLWAWLPLWLRKGLRWESWRLVGSQGISDHLLLICISLIVIPSLGLHLHYLKIPVSWCLVGIFTSLDPSIPEPMPQVPGGQNILTSDQFKPVAGIPTGTCVTYETYYMLQKIPTTITIN